MASLAPRQLADTINRHIGAPRRWSVAAETMLIFLVFLVHAAWPVPDVNEPHYLTKARHFWNPQWCAGDFFLQSDDAHLVFFATCGWTAHWLPLDAAAWLGRLATWAFLAWACARLGKGLSLEPLWTALASALFVVLVDRCHFSGEWVVGGFEAKGIAYGLVLLGLASLVQAHWKQTWLLLGGATAFHPLVGGWSVLLAAITWCVAGQNRPTLKSTLPACTAGFLLSIPGWLPALALTWGVDPAIVREANRIYVFQRLPHHLAPYTLPPEEFTLKLTRHAALLGVFLLLCWLVPADERQHRFRSFILGAVALAIIGLMIGLVLHRWPDAAAVLLKYYWFRLSDVALPLGVAFTSCLLVQRALHDQPRVGMLWLLTLLLVCGAHFGFLLDQRHDDRYPRADRKMADIPAWHDVCLWVRDNLPPGMTCLTPRQAQTFKWYAARSEVVTYKDIPQNAVGIAEWWRRLQMIHRSAGSDQDRKYVASLAELGTGQLKALGKEYCAVYLVTEINPPLDLPLLYGNGTYGVYELNRR